MSRVDVLAVMETAMGQLDKNWTGENVDPASDLREARAAVAELMAAANAGTTTSTDGFDRPAMYFNPSQTERLLDALARCGGAK